MGLQYKHSILIVDDEEQILKALQRMFRTEGYSISTATDGAEGILRIEESEKPFSLIISDQRMPGMNGSEFLERSKKLLPDATRILLTGYSDMNAITNAINKGEIYRYVTKPWDPESLKYQVRTALAHYELILENRRLLALTRMQNDELSKINRHLEEKVAERTREIASKNKALDKANQELEAVFYNTVKAFGALAELNIPRIARHGKFVCALSREIGKRLNLTGAELNQLEIASFLHDLGKLGFPQRLLETREQFWSAQEQELYRKHPEHGQAAVQFINKLDDVAASIRGHHERYDGRGFPDGLKGDEIPLGARIIAVADAYDKIVNMTTNHHSVAKSLNIGIEAPQDMAVFHLQNQSGTTYDPRVVKAAIGLFKRETKSNASVVRTSGRQTTDRYWKEKIVKINELREGMILSRSLYSQKGRFILINNTKLTDEYILNLLKYDKNDALGTIHIMDG